MPRGRRPQKPYADFPLFPHAAGQWAKKIRGRLHYFGVWADWKAALEKYQAERDDLFAGRDPRRATQAATVKFLVDSFLDHKRQAVDAGELTARSWADYLRDGQTMTTAFGAGRLVTDLRPTDFAGLRASAAGRLGPYALGTFVQRIRTIFKFGYELGLLDVPMRFGPGFAKPTRRVVRAERAKGGPRLIEAVDLRKLIGAAPVQLKAMILLGINCGFGQMDCAVLPRQAIKGKWVEFPRPKTGIHRRCPLWPETVRALADVHASRRPPLDPAHASLVFLTYFGRPWVRWRDKPDGGSRSDEAGAAFAELCDKVGIRRVGFYDLRRTHRTVADGAGDQRAADLIMGHLSPHISAAYVERVEDSRLEAVAAHVRSWLYPAKNRS